MDDHAIFAEDRGSQAGEYLAILRRRWPYILALVALAAAVAGAFLATAEKRYRAEATVLITPIVDSTDAFSGIPLFRDPTTSVYAAGQIMTTPAVTQAVTERLDLSLSRDELLDTVQIKPIEQSSSVAIEAEAGSPAGAAELANAFADVFIAKRTQEFQDQLSAVIERLEERIDVLPETSVGERSALEGQLAVLGPLVESPDPTVSLLSPAVPPESAAWPRPVLTLVVAIFAALVLGIGGALVLQSLDPRMSSEDVLLRRLPVLARIPRAPTRVVRSYLRGKGSVPPALWEGYRTLRASLAARGVGGDEPRAVLVTSAIKAEGKTMTSVNLAKTLTAGGLRVILVDSDLRRPSVAAAFGLNQETGGLEALLFGRSSIDDALVDAPGYGGWLRLLLPGSAQPIDLLEPRRIAEIIDRLKSEADVVVIDSTPLTQFADAFALADAADAVLIAVRLGHSRRDRFAELNRFLSQHDVAPAGLVVTSRRRSRAPGVAPTTGAPEPPSPDGEAVAPSSSRTTAGFDG